MCNEFYTKIEILGISCTKCLDTHLLWKNKDIKHNTPDNYDKLFVIVKCDKCSSNNDENFAIYVKTSNLYFNNIPLFNIYDNYDDNYIVRLPTVRKLYDEMTKRLETYNLLRANTNNSSKY